MQNINVMKEQLLSPSAIVWLRGVSCSDVALNPGASFMVNLIIERQAGVNMVTETLHHLKRPELNSYKSVLSEAARMIQSVEFIIQTA